MPPGAGDREDDGRDVRKTAGGHDERLRLPDRDAENLLAEAKRGEQARPAGDGRNGRDVPEDLPDRVERLAGPPRVEPHRASVTVDGDERGRRTQARRRRRRGFGGQDDRARRGGQELQRRPPSHHAPAYGASPRE